jgi:hypothetical protein
MARGGGQMSRDSGRETNRGRSNRMGRSRSGVRGTGGSKRESALSGGSEKT